MRKVFNIFVDHSSAILRNCFRFNDTFHGIIIFHISKEFRNREISKILSSVAIILIIISSNNVNEI